MLDKDHYRDYSELIAMAIENLWVLDREVTAKGSLVIGDGPAQAISIPQSSPAKPGKAAVEKKPAPVAPPPLHIPNVFRSAGLDDLSVPTADLSQSEGAKDSFTLDRWLFGQYNKLLPAKANCRPLLRNSAEHPDGTPLEETAPQIAEAAALLGDYLVDHDRRHQIGRDQALATAFPRSGPDAEKSRVRYANQFVGSVNSQGLLSGLLWDYRFVAPAPGEGTRLLLTKPAVQFARLINPVLDDNQTEPTQKFSTEEIAFILAHIRSHVPVEAFAFRTLIQAISDGADRPDSLNEALLALVPTDTNRSLSPSFLTSQRSGALSRMVDLGLIERVRKGVKVTYKMTTAGKAFAETANNDKEKE